MCQDTVCKVVNLFLRIYGTERRLGAGNELCEWLPLDPTVPLTLGCTILWEIL